MSLTLRIGQLADLAEIQKLFLDTVNEICKTDYSTSQIEAWTLETLKGTNQQRWVDALMHQYVVVAQQDDRIVGFATLDKGCHIDFLYVHKDYQRQGIANALYAKIEHQAKLQQQIVLTSHVSITARPFFEKVGFIVVEEQIVVRQGVKLTNFIMKKTMLYSTRS